MVGGDREAIRKNYLPAVRRGGWEGDIRVRIPGDPSPPLERCAGLLLTGGGDLHPHHWDFQEALHPEAEPAPARDALELPLVRQAWSLALPVLGICRGIQVLNVALGGSLFQHLPDVFGWTLERHRQGSAEDPVLCHAVVVEPASRLARILGTTQVPVNSRHHQAVARVAPRLRAVAWAGEAGSGGRRLVEGVEARDIHRWVLGVQWHPENLVGNPGPAGEAARRLFARFAEAARRHDAPMNSLL